MLTIGHAQKYASRATSLAYPSVILTPLSGPVGIARAQSGDGDNDCACESTGADSISAIATAAVFMTALPVSVRKPRAGGRYGARARVPGGRNTHERQASLVIP